MYQFLVHVEREHITRWDMAVPQDGRSVANHYYNAESVKIDYAMGNGRNDVDAETWYCADRRTADALATRFAKEKPTRQIYILETVGIAQATVSEPTISAVSQKGVLPK